MTNTVVLTTCPPWCANSNCTGDHWAEPGCESWPGIVATAYPAGGNHEIIAHPTWGEIDGLQPAVAFYIQGDVDVTIDLTQDEAFRLAVQIIRACEAIQ